MRVYVREERESVLSANVREERDAVLSADGKREREASKTECRGE